ncbi:Ankyrin repeat protein [Pandoravirus kuranda]|uniref:Ankyrin repeat protein n=1 Tax=Pandoravirus kuranda TaxID=3019033 RepID=A0AA95EI21_9VIRU|nr:Ankyrin repeat protein [Pandoravirus kuranda]
MQALPAETLDLVLNVHIDEPWRPLAAQVCARWRATIATGAKRGSQRSKRTPDGQRTTQRDRSHTNRLVIGSLTLTAAAVGQHVGLLCWLVDQLHAIVDDRVVCAAAYAGAIDSVTFFSRHTPRLAGAAARRAAARGGQRDMLAWFHARDFGRMSHASDASADCVTNGDTGAGGGGDARDKGWCGRARIRRDAKGTSVGESDPGLADGQASNVVSHHDQSDETDDRHNNAMTAPADWKDVWNTGYAVECARSDLYRCDNSDNLSGEPDADERDAWWGPLMCACAARGGHLDVLKWLRGPGVRCRWDARTILAAASGGHVHVIAWALIECKPPCRADPHRVIEWAAGSTQNNLGILRTLLATGYTPVLDDLRTALLFGRTDMADLILDRNPALWAPHEIPWWRHGTDKRVIDRCARHRTLAWAIARLDADADTWNDATEIALTYGALVGGLGTMVEALRVRGRSRAGHDIAWHEAARLCGHNPQQVIEIMRAGCTGD